MSFTSITVTGLYKQQDGTAASGSVSFRLSSPIIDSTTNEMRAPVPIEATLNGSGAISLALTATNDPTTTPSGVTYRVIERITGASMRSYSIEVPYNSAGGTLDLADVAPVASATITYGIVASILTTKGDVIAATGAAVASRVGVGANGLPFVADSASTPGVKWGASDGSAGVTGFAPFTAEPTSNWFRIGAGILGWAILGVERLRLSATELLVSAGLNVTGVIKTADGTVGAPSVASATEPTTGIVSRLGVGIWGIAVLGVEYLRLSATELKVSTSVAIKGPRPWLDLRAWAAGDGTNEAVALQAAFTAATAGYTIMATPPPVAYATSTAISIPNFVQVIGQGQSSVFRALGNNYIFDVNPGTRSRVSNIWVDAASTQSAGGAFDFTNSGGSFYLDHIYFATKLFISLNITPSTPSGTFWLTDLRWTFASDCTTAIVLGDGTNLITDVIMERIVGTSPTSGGIATWMDIRRSTDSIQMSNVTLYGGSSTGIKVGLNGASGVVSGCSWNGLLVDNMAGTGIDFANCRGIELTSAQVQSSGTTALPGVNIGATAKGVRFIGGTIQNCPSDGVTVANGATFWAFDGTTISDNNTSNTASKNGITVGAGTTDWKVINCDIGNNMLLATGHQKYGLSIASGGSDRYEIINNRLYRNDTGPLNDLGTGVIKVVDNNLGVDTAGTALVDIPNTVPNRMYLPDGTLALPPLAFSLDTDTGIQRSATDSLKMVVGGTSAMIFGPPIGAAVNGFYMQPRAAGSWPIFGTVGASADIGLDLRPVGAGGVLVKTGTGGLGYGTGVGGAVTQITSSATAVTLNKVCGQITTVALTTAAGAEERFTVNNTTVVATDCIVLGTTYNGAGTPAVTVLKVGANLFDIVITNLHATAALDNVMVISFAVIKAVTN